MESTVSPYPNQQITGKKKSPAIIIAVVAVIVIGGFFIFRQSKKNNQPQVIGVASNKEPTPTEKPKVDKQTVKIQVLNGTGTPGQAGGAVDALKEAGYNADNIKTDNATDSDHTVTTVAAKVGFEDIANDIKTALTSLFDKIDIDSSPLGSDGEFDIVVTTGGKKYEMPTPSVSPTPNPTDTPTPSASPSATPI